MHRRLSILALIFPAAIAIAASGVIAVGASGAAAADAGAGSQGEVPRRFPGLSLKRSTLPTGRQTTSNWTRGAALNRYWLSSESDRG